MKDDIDRPKISLGIPTGSYAHPTVLSDSTTEVGFQDTNDIKDGNTVQHWIDMSITNIITALTGGNGNIADLSNVTILFYIKNKYSKKDSIGTGIFSVSNSVIDYITDKINTIEGEVNKLRNAAQASAPKAASPKAASAPKAASSKAAPAEAKGSLLSKTMNLSELLKLNIDRNYKYNWDRGTTYPGINSQSDLDKYKLFDETLFNYIMKGIGNIYEKKNDEKGEPILYIIKKIINIYTKVIIIGDIHSSLYSFLQILGQLRVDNILNDDFTLNQNYNLVFLGDLVDRGPFSIEVLLIAFK